MTLDQIRKKKKKVLAEKPSAKQAALNYELFNKEMDEWVRKVEALVQQEKDLEREIIYRKLELEGKISNLEKRRANRLTMIDMLKDEYRRVGLDRRFNKETAKALQWEFCMKIVDAEAQVEEFGVEIDKLVAEILDRM